MVYFKIYLKRLYRKLKNLFNTDIFIWSGESCKVCGNTILIIYGIKDDLYKKVNNSLNDCYCLDCFYMKAFKKNIEIKKSDFQFIELIPFQFMREDKI